MNILVTGAGGPAGVNVIQELLSQGHIVVACDCDPQAAGFSLADRTELMPRAEDSTYGEVLLGVLLAHDIDVIVSTIVEELVILDGLRQSLLAIGVAHWGPSRTTIETCADKLSFAKALQAHGVATPPTSVDGWRRIPGPWIVKPRDGRGSRDVHAVDTRAALRAARRLTPNPMVQSRIEGREFSVDALVSLDGAVLGSAARWRDACRGGISTAGTTFHDHAVDHAVAGAVRAVELTGPANIQGFVTNDGDVVIIEINPRFSGALPLSLASGCDLVGQFIDGALGRPVDRARLVSKPGVTMTRIFREIFTSADDRVHRSLGQVEVSS